MPDEVLGDARVARQDDGAAGIVDSITERWSDWRMIYLKRRDLYACVVIHHALTDLRYEQRDAVR